MPPTPINPTAKYVIHSQVDVDAEIGIKNGEVGLIINGLDITPTREVVNKMDHVGRKVMSIHKSPGLTLKLDAEVTQIAGLLSAPHPASALTLADVANFYPAVAHGFPTNSGYFHIEEPGLKGTQGDLWKTSPSLVLDWLPSDTPQVFRAAA